MQQPVITPISLNLMYSVPVDTERESCGFSLVVKLKAVVNGCIVLHSELKQLINRSVNQQLIKWLDSDDQLRVQFFFLVSSIGSSLNCEHLLLCFVSLYTDYLLVLVSQKK